MQKSASGVTSATKGMMYFFILCWNFEDCSVSLIEINTPTLLDAFLTA